MTFSATVVDGTSYGKAILHFTSGGLKGMKMHMVYTLPYDTFLMEYTATILNPHGE